ncbi:MAG: class I SAM-dependent methyltransferase [Halothiobacillaceae bacterium]|nr:class I SAM-dependent methyltransferase [Halothiobacillaceae bacterium]
MNSISSEPRPSCPMCGGSGATAVSGIRDSDRQLDGDWSFRLCGSCGVYWLDPAPPPRDMWRAYATYHTHARNRDHRLVRSLLSLAHRFIRLGYLPSAIASGLKQEADALRFMMLGDVTPGRLLDVGCGGGRFLRRMQKRGWQVAGTDFDEQATRRVSERYGIETHVGDLPQCALPAASFDAITLSQSIEHLYDPGATLRECLRLLRPGGLLVMTTPNAASIGAAEFGPSWRGWEAPRHLQLFTVDALASLTRTAGFEIVDARTCSAGSAVVYRVSREITEGGPGSGWHRLAMLAWSHGKELHEQRAQSNEPYTGQNVLIRARKP